MKAGDRVIIRYNPHHGRDAEDILGIVVSFSPGTGFMGCDLAEVRYEIPRTGATHVLPFATYNLSPGDRATLIEIAERHERMAVELRRLAGS